MRGCRSGGASSAAVKAAYCCRVEADARALRQHLVRGSESAFDHELADRAMTFARRFLKHALKTGDMRRSSLSERFRDVPMVVSRAFYSRNNLLD